LSLQLEQLPGNCTYNYRHALDSRKRLNGEPNPDYNSLDTNKTHLPVIGLCMYGAEDVQKWHGNICEDKEHAQQCPMFEPKKTQTEVKEELYLQLKDPEWLTENWPEMGALLWVLEESPALSWWDRFKMWWV